jgi:hypothetical protein
MTDVETALVEIERNGLSASFMLVAIAREVEAVAARDARLMASADNIRLIASTLDMVDDAVVAKLATVNTISEGLLTELITERLAAVGFTLPLCADAKAFFAPIEAMANRILHDARLHIH